jgi:hypothetical protein
VPLSFPPLAWDVYEKRRPQDADRSILHSYECMNGHVRGSSVMTVVLYIARPSALGLMVRTRQGVYKWYVAGKRGVRRLVISTG